MPNYRRYKSSIINNTNIYGIMGGLASVRINGISDKNRATSKLTIPSDPVKGLEYMREHNLLSVNPQCTGGVGRLRHIGCGCCNNDNSLPQPPQPPPPPATLYKCVSRQCVACDTGETGCMSKETCNSTCGAHIHCPSGKHLAPDGTSCLSNNCTCPNGTPPTGTACTTDGAAICTSCNPGYHLAPDGTSCLSNNCTCPNGTPPIGTACTTDGAAICTSCNPGYHLAPDGKSCLSNNCTCPNGTPPIGTACTTDGAAICTSCNPGYHLAPDGKSCLSNNCTCPNGTPPIGTACTTDGAAICTSCNPGYHLAPDGKSCLSNNCTCPDGTPPIGTACTTDGAAICTSCNPGYHLAPDGKSCLSNNCTCPNGTPPIGTACTTDGAAICTSCNPGYHLAPDGKSCLSNNCTCPNGTPPIGTACTPHNTVVCISCNTGYYLDGSLCTPNMCDCSNGIGASGEQCPTNGDKKCASCNKDYHLNKDNECIHNDDWKCLTASGDCSPPWPESTTCQAVTPSSIKNYINEWKHLGSEFSGDPAGYGYCGNTSKGTLHGASTDSKGNWTCSGVKKCTWAPDCSFAGNLDNRECIWSPNILNNCKPLYKQPYASFKRNHATGDLELCNSQNYQQQNYQQQNYQQQNYQQSADLDCTGLTVDASNMDNLAFYIRQADLSHSDTYPDGVEDASAALSILNQIGEKYHKNVVVGDTDGYTCKAYELQNIFQSGWKQCSSDGCITHYNQAFDTPGTISNTQGCGWWGRGVIQTTGPCNFGKLQHTLEKDPNYKTAFNLCKTPDLICNSEKYPELKWLAGFNYWIYNIQKGTGRFNWGIWDFDTQLSNAAHPSTGADCSSCSYALNVSGGNEYSIVSDCYTKNTSGSNCDGEQPWSVPASVLHYNPSTAIHTSCSSSCWTDASTNDLVKFMNAASGLVNRGCPALTCNTGAVDAASGRLKYSQIVLSILNKAHIAAGADVSSVLYIVEHAESEFENTIIRTYGGQGVAPVSSYDFAGFKQALTNAIHKGLGGEYFFDASSNDPTSMMKAKINLAAFLGQSMQETLQYGACDENNWTQGDAANMGIRICNQFKDKASCNAETGQPGICEWNEASGCHQIIYGTGNWSCETAGGTCPDEPSGNLLPTNFKYYQNTSSCGQLGQNYSALGKTGCDESCDIDFLKKRTISATTSAVWTGAPGPQVSHATAGPNERYYWDNLIPSYPIPKLLNWKPASATAAASSIDCKWSSAPAGTYSGGQWSNKQSCSNYCTEKLPGATLNSPTSSATAKLLCIPK